MNSSRSSFARSSKTASKPGEGVRLNRWLAECGICSRRQADELIRAGEIRVNGETCLDLSRRVDPALDEVYHRGKKLRPPARHLYLILNKPRGYLLTRSDEHQRQTIYDRLPQAAAKLRYAGRLDKDSEGLLLLTDDGDLINRLTHPSHKVEKVYKAELNRRLGPQELEALRRGVSIEGGSTHPAGVFVKRSTPQGMTLRIVLTEGRKRQIRQMAEAVGARVLRLKRLQFGCLTLKDLPSGRWRPLDLAEVRALKRLTEDPPR